MTRCHQARVAEGGQQAVEIVLQSRNGGCLAVGNIGDLRNRFRLAEQIVASLDGRSGQEGQLTANDQLVAAVGKVVVGVLRR